METLSISEYLALHPLFGRWVGRPKFDVAFYHPDGTISYEGLRAPEGVDWKQFLPTTWAAQGATAPVVESGALDVMDGPAGPVVAPVVGAGRTGLNVIPSDKFHYRVARAGEYDAAALRECQKAALVCCENLKLWDVRVLPAVMAGPGEDAFFGSAKLLVGFCVTRDPEKVYVRFDAGRDLEDLIKTVGHEVAHHWQYATGRKDGREHDENFCNLIGFNLARQMGY